MQGIKETKEAVLGVMALGFYVAKLAKDGIQMADAGALLAKLQGDAEFAAKLKAAYEGIEQVPAEIKDITVAEGIELAMEIIPAAIKEFGA
jgi:hypothetical protein